MGLVCGRIRRRRRRLSSADSCVMIRFASNSRRLSQRATKLDLSRQKPSTPEQVGRKPAIIFSCSKRAIEPILFYRGPSIAQLSLALLEPEGEFPGPAKLKARRRWPIVFRPIVFASPSIESRRLQSLQQIRLASNDGCVIRSSEGQLVRNRHCVFANQDAALQSARYESRLHPLILRHPISTNHDARLPICIRKRRQTIVA